MNRWGQALSEGTRCVPLYHRSRSVITLRQIMLVSFEVSVQVRLKMYRAWRPAWTLSLFL